MWNLKEKRTEPDPSPAKVSSDRPAVTPGKDFTEGKARRSEQTAVVGPAIRIKGELTGNEDLVIDGTVEGKVDLSQYHLTIGPHGKIKADIYAKRITIQGEVGGNVTAQEGVDVRDRGKVNGDIIAPRIAISEGALFNGRVEMKEGKA